jgi:hypothetical protein
MKGFETLPGVQSRVVFLATLIAFVCMMSLATVPASFLVDDSAAGNYGSAAISDHADSGTAGKYMLATSRLGKFFYRLGDKLGLYNGKKTVSLFDPNAGAYVTKKVWKYDKSETVSEWNAAHPYDACSVDADCDDGDSATLDNCTQNSGVRYCTHVAGTLQTFYRDNDGDGYGDPATSVTESAAPNGYVTNSGDCDDNNAELNPDTIWYKDFDNDRYSNGSTLVQCTQPSGYKLAGALLSLSGDCDDNNAEINPNTTWYKDFDNDGYSDGTTQGGQCTQPQGYKLASQLIATSGDTDDNDATIHPGANVTATFSGRVTDSETGLALPGKKISFYQDTGIDSQYGNVANLENYMYSKWQALAPKATPDAVTDASGFFYANLPDGTYNYVIQGSREDELEAKVSGSGKRDSQIARTKIVLPRAGYVKVYFEKASAALKSDVYMGSPNTIFMIANSTVGASYVTSNTYANGTELKFFIRVNGTPWGLGIYDHWSDSQYAQVEQLDIDTWRISFEDLPANSADWDFNDAVVLVDLIDSQNSSVNLDCDGDGNPNYNDTNDSWCDIGDNSSAQIKFNADGHILYSGKYEDNNNYTCGQRVRFVMFGTNNGSAAETVTFEVQDHTSNANPDAPIVYSGSISNAGESLTVPGGNSTAEKNFDWTIPCPRNVGRYDIHMIWKGEVWRTLGDFYVIPDTTVPEINIWAPSTVYRNQPLTVGYWSGDPPQPGSMPDLVVQIQSISNIPDTSIQVKVNKDVVNNPGAVNFIGYGGNQEINLTYNQSGYFTTRLTAIDASGNEAYKEFNVSVWITENDADAIAYPIYDLFFSPYNGMQYYKLDWYDWLNASSPKMNGTWDHYNNVWRIGDEYITPGNNLTSEGACGGNDACAKAGFDYTIAACGGPEYMKPILPSTAAEYNQTLYDYLFRLNSTYVNGTGCNAI